MSLQKIRSVNYKSVLVEGVCSEYLLCPFLLTLVAASTACIFQNVKYAIFDGYAPKLRRNNIFMFAWRCWNHCYGEKAWESLHRMHSFVDCYQPLTWESRFSVGISLWVANWIWSWNTGCGCVIFVSCVFKYYTNLSKSWSTERLCNKLTWKPDWFIISHDGPTIPQDCYIKLNWITQNLTKPN